LGRDLLLKSLEIVAAPMKKILKFD
jgi:hypothetical protein